MNRNEVIAMRLKDDIDYSDFLKTVQSCRGEVLLVTPEGDQLNLKSTLSQFVFAAAMRGSLKLSEGKLELANGEDARLLERFAISEG